MKLCCSSLLEDFYLLLDLKSGVNAFFSLLPETQNRISEPHVKTDNETYRINMPQRVMTETNHNTNYI